jgi:hypothetical protein
MIALLARETRRAGTPADRVELAVPAHGGDPAVVVSPWVRPICPRRRSKPYSTASRVRLVAVRARSSREPLNLELIELLSATWSFSEL